MPPGSIDKATLRALTSLTLSAIAPNRSLDDDAFEGGLGWSTKEVAAFAALVQREPAGESQVERFRAFDGIVSWAFNHDSPLEPEVWDFAITRASDLDRLWVGMAAYHANDSEAAVRAFEVSLVGDDPGSAALAGVLLGIVRRETGHDAEALTAYDSVVGRFGDVDQPALRQQVARALVNKGLMLHELGKQSDAIAASDQVLRRFGDATEPGLRVAVAIALWNKGLALA